MSRYPAGFTNNFRGWLAPYDQPLTRNECKAEFCFYIADLIKFLDVSDQPDPIVSSSGLNVLALDGLCQGCPTYGPRVRIRPAKGIYLARQLVPSPSSKYLSKQRWPNISLKCQSSHCTVYTAVIQHD